MICVPSEFAQSDQSLSYPHEDTLSPKLSIERIAKKDFY